MKKYLPILIVVALVFTLGAVTVGSAFAAYDYGLSNLDSVEGLRQDTDINETIAVILQWALGFAGAVAVAFLVYGGFRYTTSAGNETLREQAKTIILYAILGLVIIIVAFVIISTVTGIFNAGTGSVLSN